MLTVPANVTRTHLPLSYVSANIVPIVAIMSLSATGEARMDTITWRDASNVHEEANTLMRNLWEHNATILAVLEGEEDMSTNDMSLTF